MRRRITSSYEEFYFKKYQGMITNIIFKIMPLDLFEDGMSIARQEMIWAMAHFDPQKASLITYVFHRISGILKQVRSREVKANTVSLENILYDRKLLIWKDKNAIEKIELDDFLSQCLTEDEVNAFKKYFGDGKSLRAVGEEMGYSRTTVLNLCDSAINKCRVFVQKQGLFCNTY